jgi:hypothetical protein
VPRNRHLRQRSELWSEQAQERRARLTSRGLAISVRFFLTLRFTTPVCRPPQDTNLSPATGETRSSVTQSDSVKFDTRHWSASLRAAINHLRVNEEPSSA